MAILVSKSSAPSAKHFESGDSWRLIWAKGASSPFPSLKIILVAASSATFLHETGGEILF